MPKKKEHIHKWSMRIKVNQYVYRYKCACGATEVGK